MFLILTLVVFVLNLHMTVMSIGISFKDFLWGLVFTSFAFGAVCLEILNG
jgi:hypothetical protein